MNGINWDTCTYQTPDPGDPGPQTDPLTQNHIRMYYFIAETAPVEESPIDLDLSSETTQTAFCCCTNASYDFNLQQEEDSSTRNPHLSSNANTTSSASVKHTIGLIELEFDAQILVRYRAILHHRVVHSNVWCDLE